MPSLLSNLGRINDLIDLELREYDVSFRVSHDEWLIHDEAVSLVGWIGDVPVRFDFYSPSVAREGGFAVALFELEPSRLIIREASNVGFADVLANCKWAYVAKAIASRDSASTPSR